jgi:hypothetical protein
MYGKLICILYALLCWQNFILVKSGCYKAPTQSCRNRTVRLGKPDGPVLSGPNVVRGAAGFRREALPLAKWHLDGGEA